MPNPRVPVAETGLSHDFDESSSRAGEEIEVTPCDCPIEKLAREACGIIEASRALEASKPEFWQDAEKQFMERLSDLEAAATSARARSARGAMFQICALSDLIDEINEEGFSQSLYRRLRRGLYSILSVLEILSGERIETCRAYYLSLDLDPFARDGEAA